MLCFSLIAQVKAGIGLCSWAQESTKHSKIRTSFQSYVPSGRAARVFQVNANLCAEGRAGNLVAGLTDFHQVVSKVDFLH